ncbi:glycosyltransferase family 2 protein [Actinoplanes aureus]|uniref:Glycosyltransferase family 2 protein n=1 Tax=Actinoplanes aureus TaxID=2792083 RepID=A0A931CFK9_9ACTN|nr:glycosyltransferase family 2 protein [Actinoplanes aureus]MBG0565203.1 glycosyltransferase family 2 protein [Actinoplanes aureus]
MYQGLKVAVVVPAYNEEKLIGQTINTVPEFVDHIIVIDDTSKDATSERARETGEPRLTLIRHEVNTGVGGAICDGHKEALRLGCDVSVVMAGDAQMDPDYLPDLLAPIVDGLAQFTKANRFYSRDSYRGMPAYRIFGNVILSFMTKLASGYWHLFDPQNGYTAIHRSALERLDLDRVARDYSFENDLLINLNILRVPACDVPIPAVYGEETSTMRMHRVIPALLGQLTRGFWRRILLKYVIYSFSPIALLLLAGLPLIAFGLVAGIWVVVHTLGAPVVSAGSALLAALPLLTGIHLLIAALSLDIQESPDRVAVPATPSRRNG